MDTASRLAFDEQAQASFEAQYPAELLAPDALTPIPCAGGTVRNGASRLFPGGVVDEYAVGFRVRKEHLPAGLPEVGTRWQWRRLGEPTFRPAFRLSRASDTGASVAYFLGGENTES